MSIVGNTNVSFTVQSSLEIAHRVAQLLALGDLHGCGWICAVVTEVHLVRNNTLRVVMVIVPKDVGRVLSVEKWARLHTANVQAEALECSEMPKWVLLNTTNGLPRSNLACAKTIVEILMLLLIKIENVSLNDDRAQELCFNRNMHDIKYRSPMPLSINKTQLESLIEMSEAWNEYLGALWKRPADLPPTPRLLLPGPTDYHDVLAPRFDPLDLPVLVSSSHGSRVQVAGRTRYSEGVAIVSVSQLLGEEEIYAPFVAKINVDDTKNLWAVAWMAGHPREDIWLSGLSANDIRYPLAALSI